MGVCTLPRSPGCLRGWKARACDYESPDVQRGFLFLRVTSGLRTDRANSSSSEAAESVLTAAWLPVSGRRLGSGLWARPAPFAWLRRGLLRLGLQL